MRRRRLLEGMRRTEVDMWNQAKEVTRAGMAAGQLYAEYRSCPYEKQESGRHTSKGPTANGGALQRIAR